MHYVDTASQGVRSRTNLVYEDDQSWVPTKRALDFILEDGAGAEYGTTDFIERDERRDEAVEICDPHQLEETCLVDTPRAPVMAMESSQANIDVQSFTTEDTSTLNSNVFSKSPESSPPITSSHAPLAQHTNSRSRDATRNPAHISAIVEDYISPNSLSDLSRRHDSGRHLIWGTGENGFLTADSIRHNFATETLTLANKGAINPEPSNLTHREAVLMQHFTQKLAPWMDCCDPVCHFAQEVPKRAVRKPMVFFAVLALSSLHQSLMTSGDALEATFYHGRCLELVILELSKPTYDDTLFATMVCMRVYEELDDKVDAFLHLAGVGRILRAIPTFAHSGGLAEAASWQALRQDIYVSLRNKVQPSFDLDNYGLSRAFDFRDDGACANVIILLFARLLRLLHSRPKSALYDDWREIEHHVEQWDAQRSLIFQPLFVKEANIDEAQSFPIIRLINPAQGKNCSSFATIKG